MGIERTYRNLPEKVGRRLIADRILPQPNEIIDSAEGGFRLPGIERKADLDELVEQLTRASNDAAEELLQEYEAAARENGGPPLEVDGEPERS